MSKTSTRATIAMTAALAFGLTGIATAATRLVPSGAPVPVTRAASTSTLASPGAHLIRVAASPAVQSEAAAMVRILSDQLTIDNTETAQLESIQRALHALVKLEIHHGVTAASAPPLSLAGCSFGGNEFPKGAEVDFTPNQSEICTDAIAGKPTYGLAWHLLKTSQTK
ncbi:MAG: hypothetical protein PHT60_15015 [Acidiphilium sp.]|nr:hypothetical protein [Acidiphilium sp.]MDD4937073.1 hypothetical protein [Acidiphilium sp.]